MTYLSLHICFDRVQGKGFNKNIANDYWFYKSFNFSMSVFNLFRFSNNSDIIQYSALKIISVPTYVQSMF